MHDNKIHEGNKDIIRIYLDICTIFVCLLLHRPAIIFDGRHINLALNERWEAKTAFNHLGESVPKY